MPVRESTQDLESDPDLGVLVSPPPLAVGTAEEERTKVESPGARATTRSPLDRRPGHRRSRSIPMRRSCGSTRCSVRIGCASCSARAAWATSTAPSTSKLGREVALKLLRGDYARRREAVNQFFQEAKTVNRVRHRNIVDVTDFIELDDGTTFIIMELLSGRSLGKWLASGVEQARVIAVLVQICEGLGAAHTVGVVHRDLKPDNVFVIPTSEGPELVKLLDFGVAKLVNRDDEDLGFQTQAGSVIGTPAYMSPEQAGSMVVDQRSDIYSLGAIMYASCSAASRCSAVVRSASSCAST